MSETNGKKPRVAIAKPLRNVKFSNPGDKDGQKHFPCLYELLCPVWQDGKCLRQPGRLSLRVDGGLYVVAIECPTEGLQATVSVAGLSTCLQEVEKAVMDGLCNWGPTWAKRKKYSPTVDDLIE